jgi:hypothetical protein
MGGRKGEKRVLGIQMGRRRVVQDRQEDEGTEFGGLYRLFTEESDGKGRREGRRWLGSQTKFLDPHCYLT